MNERPKNTAEIGELDISQAKILNQLAIYLKQENRDSSLIDKMTEGHCCGFSSLSLYGLWLELNIPKDPLTPRDDWSYLKGLYQKICSWNPSHKLLPEEKAEFDRLISLVVNSHQVNNLGDKTTLTQGNLNLSLLDTQGRQPQKEYSLAGLFSPQDLSRKYAADLDGKIKLTYLMDLIAVENRLVMIGSHNHETGLFRKDGVIYYSDSNMKTGITIIDNCSTEEGMRKLSRLIFNAHFGEKKVLPGPLEFMVFSFEKEQAKYPPQEKLLKNTAIIQAKKVNFSLTSYNKMTALHAASLIGCYDSAKFFIDRGANVNAANNKGQSPLHLVAMNGDINLAKLLLKNTGINLAALDKGNLLALDWAALNGHFEMVNLLLDEMLKRKIEFTMGYVNQILSITKDINIRTVILQTLLANELMAQVPARDKLSALQQLIKNEEYGTTSLHQAAYQNDPVLGQKALDSHITINKKDSFSKTALHVAAEKGNLEILQFLLNQKGIDFNAKDSNGKTALHCAIENNHVSCAKNLAENFAGLAVRDQASYAALSYLDEASAEMRETLKFYVLPPESSLDSEDAWVVLESDNNIDDTLTKAGPVNDAFYKDDNSFFDGSHNKEDWLEVGDELRDKEDWIEVGGEAHETDPEIRPLNNNSNKMAETANRDPLVQKSTLNTSSNFFPRVIPLKSVNTAEVEKPKTLKVAGKSKPGF